MVLACFLRTSNLKGKDRIHNTVELTNATRKPMIKYLVSTIENESYRNLAVSRGGWRWQSGREGGENRLVAKAGPDVVLRNSAIRKLLEKTRWFNTYVLTHSPY